MRNSAVRLDCACSEPPSWWSSFTGIQAHSASRYPAVIENCHEVGDSPRRNFRDSCYFHCVLTWLPFHVLKTIPSFMLISITRPNSSVVAPSLPSGDSVMEVPSRRWSEIVNLDGKRFRLQLSWPPHQNLRFNSPQRKWSSLFYFGFICRLVLCLFCVSVTSTPAKPTTVVK